MFYSILKVMVPLMVIAVMMVVGMSLTWSDFVRLKRKFGTIVMGSLGAYLLLPLCAWLIVCSVEFSQNIEFGLLLIAACPGGGVSNFYTYLARANTALSIVMTGTSSILSVVLMPLALLFYQKVGFDSEAFSVPVAQVFVRLFILVLLPICVGMWLRNRYPEQVIKKEPFFRGISVGVILFVVSYVLFQAPPLALQEWLESFIISFSFCVVALLVAFLMGVLLKLDTNDRFALMIEYMIQNAAVAVVIAVSVMGYLEFATIAAIYALVQFPVVGGMIMIRRRWCAWFGRQSSKTLKH